MLGLDVGTSAVRVVEVTLNASGSSGPRPVIRVFGQVPLPAGAARDGEVVDPAAVGEAIAQLWRETGLRQRDVRVGLASQRVVIREVELPAMPEAELAGAVRFSAQDHIPMPLEEAVLDFTVLQRTAPGGVPDVDGDANRTVRVLVAAAHREPVDRLLQAVAAGGLRVVGVDLVPFALVRALAGEPDAAARQTGETGAAPEAIVSVGAGVTTVVVHEGGYPRFVRTVATGGQALTAAVAEELQVSLEEAEAAKRAPGLDDLGARAATVVESRLAGVLGEIQGSLNYWMGQSDRPLSRVLVTGGGALAGDLAGRLALLVGVPVEIARPRERLDIDPDVEAGPDDDVFLTTAAGLALGAVRSHVRRIDLNPSPARPPVLSRRAGAGLAAAAAVLVLLLGGLTVVRAVALNQEQDRLSAQERTNSGVQGEIQALAGLGAMNTQLEAGRERVQSALAGDVAWTRLLEDLGRSMPETVWLQSFNAQTSTSGPGATGTAATPAAAGGVGTASFTVVGLDFPSVASWLHTIGQEQAFSGLTVASLTKSPLGSRSVVNFSSTARLTAAARSDRARQVMTAAL